MVSKDEFKGGMSRFATGVTVVTTLDHLGKPHGMTANSFTSVSLEPPLALICADFKAHSHQYIKALGLFGVNILSEDQQDVGKHFARPPQDRSADAIDLRMSELGLPIIEHSMAFFGCRVVDSHVHGDHTIYIGSVDEMWIGKDKAPLLYFASAFTSLEGQRQD